MWSESINADCLLAAIEVLNSVNSKPECASLKSRRFTAILTESLVKVLMEDVKPMSFSERWLGLNFPSVFSSDSTS